MTLRTQCVKPQDRITEQLGQMDRQLPRIKREHPSPRIAFDVPRQVFDPRLIARRRDTQAGESSGNAEIVQPRLCSIPAKFERVQPSPCLQGLQARAQRGIHRQARQYRFPATQSKRLGGNLARFGIPGHPHIERCAQCRTRTRNAQVFKFHPMAVRLPLPRHLPEQLRQPQCRQLIAQHGFDRSQIEPRVYLCECTAFKIKRDMQCPCTLPGLIRQLQPGCQIEERHSSDPGLDAPAPGFDVVRLAGCPLRLNHQWPRQTGRRGGKQLQSMVTARIDQGETSHVQRHRRGMAHLIQPGQRSLAHMHLPLTQQPADKSAVGRSRIDGNASHIKMAVLRAPHPQRQSLQFDMAEARLQKKQRTPGKSCLEFRQVQRCTILLIVQANALQSELGPRLLPHSGHGFERDPLAQRA